MPHAETIRAHAPLRLGLAGGGTDLASYCERFDGAVLNATIDRYAFASIAPSPDGMIRFAAGDLDIAEAFPADFEALAASRLLLHAGVYRRMVQDFGGGRPIPLSIVTHVDAPAGSGLGSSSALVLAMVEALRHRFAAPLGPYETAQLAFTIERLDLGLAGGKQDQYAAAFGGINFIEFLAQGRVIVNPLRVGRAVMNELESSLVICFSGVSRRSAEIIDEQQRELSASSDAALEAMHQLKADAIDMKRALLEGDIGGMAEILGHSWRAKKRTAAGVSSPRIEELHAIAMAQGALGGKVSGAGGGGFLMFIVPPERRMPVLRALNATGAQASGVDFSWHGAEAWTAPSPPHRGAVVQRVPGPGLVRLS